MSKELVVEIEIQQGIANVLKKSKGVKLIIRDTDTDGADPEEDDRLIKAKDGDYYYWEEEYEAGEKI